MRRDRRVHFNPNECIGVVNYLIADHPKFDYSWTPSGNPAFSRQVAPLVERRKRVREKFGMRGKN